MHYSYVPVWSLWIGYERARHCFFDMSQGQAGAYRLKKRLLDLARSRADWRSIMKAKEVMTRNVISVAPDASILEALRLMLLNKISGLPVVTKSGQLVGIITEGDFLRRTETGTERKRPHWLEFIASPARLADDYVHSHGRTIEEVMTFQVETVSEEAELENVVTLMEKHGIKRLPVMRGDELVGIVSRANLLHALAGIAREIPEGPKTDESIRDLVLAELDHQSWVPKRMIDATVRNAVVDLWGTVLSPEQRDAVRVAAENVPGVKAVRSHVAWIEPLSGMAFPDPEDEGDAHGLPVPLSIY
jgi:CBS domain-containing protein